MIASILARAGRTVTRSGRRRRLTSFAGPLLGLAIGLAGGAAPGMAAETYAFGGEAFGSYANAKAGPISASLGKTAYLALSCLGTNGKTAANVVSSLSVGSGGAVLQADTIRSTAFTERTATAARLKNSSTVSGLSLLGGLIKASAITAVANVAADAGSITSSSDGSSFVGLTVAGRAVAANVAANTRLDLPGVGYVILNRVSKSGTSTQAAIVTDMLTVVVTQSNGLGLGTGAQIIVARATGRITRVAGEALVAGAAYAASANAAIGSALQSQIGTLAYVPMGCDGTGGKTATNNIASFSAGTVLAVGSGETTAFGQTGNSGAVAETTATLQNLRLLNGLITATTIKAVAKESFQGGQRSRTTAGSGFVGLKIGGIPAPLNAGPNTRLSVPGFGYLILNEQKVPAATAQGWTEVTGLRLVIDKANLLQLPVGAQIILARAVATTLKP